MKNLLGCFFRRSLSKRVGIIGSGITGLSAAVELGLEDVETVLFEKEKGFGGTTKMAVVGLNAIGTRFEEDGDGAEVFIQDTILGGSGSCNEELVEIMVNNSAEGIEFLEEVVGFELTKYSCVLGGHSFSRVHGMDTTKTRRIFGGELIYHLLKKAETVEEYVELRSGCEVRDFEILEDGRINVVYETSEGATGEECFTDLIIAAGGYSGNDVLIGENFEKIIDHQVEFPESFPTTNGPGSNSDILLLCEDKLNASLIDLSEIQIHPTAVLNPKSPGRKHVMLCSDALRGCGSVMVNQEGRRFTNELGTRDEISRDVMELCSSFFPENERKVAFMVFDNEVVEKFGEDHLKGHRKMKDILTFPNSTELCEELGIQDQEVFDREILPFDSGEELHVMFVTPAIHYTMGGIEINGNSQVLDRNGEVIEHVYAAGEVSGGVHGKNRLPGNALLDCLVFGRVAAKHILQNE